MRKFLFSLLMILALPFVALALEEDGYTFSEGYWWKNGAAYSRQKEYWGLYYYYGQPYYRYYYYTYSPVVKTINPQAPDAESKLLDLAAARDRFEGGLRLANQKHAAFLEKVDKLGLAGNFNWQGYGAASPHPVGGVKSLQYGAYGSNGPTVYGYNYNQVADYYGTLDPSVLFQQSASLVKGAQGLAQQGNSEFNGVVGTAIAGINRAAEIREQGLAAARTLEASKAAPQGRVVTSGTGAAPLPGGVAQPDGSLVPPGGQNVISPKLTAAAALRNEMCAACHSGQNKKGNVDITKYNEMTDDQKSYVISIMTTADEKHRMPRKADGSPGSKVTMKQLEAFFKP